MVTGTDPWLSMVIVGYHWLLWLLLVIIGYLWLSLVIIGYHGYS